MVYRMGMHQEPKNIALRQNQASWAGGAPTLYFVQQCFPILVHNRVHWCISEPSARHCALVHSVHWDTASVSQDTSVLRHERRAPRRTGTASGFNFCNAYLLNAKACR